MLREAEMAASAARNDVETHVASAIEEVAARLEGIAHRLNDAAEGGAG